MATQPEKDRIGLAIRQMIEDMLWEERERIADRVRNIELLHLPQTNVDPSEEPYTPLDEVNMLFQQLTNAIEKDDWSDWSTYPGA